MSRNDYSSGMVELRIPAKAEYIQLVRTVIGEVASINPNLNLGRIADLRLAVSEAVTNAYREHTRQNIEDQIFGSKSWPTAPPKWSQGPKKPQK